MIIFFIVSIFENPDVFKAEMEVCGFKGVKIIPVTKSFIFESADDFWKKMLRGSAPIVMLKKDLGPIWSEKEHKALNFLREKLGSNLVSLSSDAWLGVGIK
jgi:hypothetical protein